MSNFNEDGSMIEMYIFETLQLIERLEQLILNSEKSNELNSEINEIFRIMHTIKGNSMMMLFENIGNLAHAIEDLFDYLRKENPKEFNYTKVTDLVLETLDFIKNELSKLENGDTANGDASDFIVEIEEYLESLKFMNPVETDSTDVNKQQGNNKKNQKYTLSSMKTASTKTQNIYQALIFFAEGCEMENVRAFTIIHNLKEMVYDIFHFPKNLTEDTNSVEIIKNNGFKIAFKTELSLDEIESFFSRVSFIEKLELRLIQEIEYENLKNGFSKDKRKTTMSDKQEQSVSASKQQDALLQHNLTEQKYISVGVTKLDMLMDLVGELVVSEAMVTQNPELQNLPLDNFYKAARQLRKIINDLQDIVMSIRMVPLSMTFQKMNRLVRDMSKKVKKKVELEIIGQETEVDKNVIEHICDPLMHLIRNAVDHGIETVEDRKLKNKSEKGKVTLEARHSGGYVWLIVKDNGRGLDKNKIIEKALKKGILDKPVDEYSDKEVYSLIFQPGFSTNDEVTEFSGRGVGLDVVTQNIEKIGGTIIVDSIPNEGTEISIKIPLTLAIIDGMIMKVGKSMYTVPITAIKESFSIKAEDVIRDPEGNEMLLVRGECYPILRLYERFNVKTNIKDFEEGIIVMIEHDSEMVCLFVDALIGEQQVVVKSLSKFIDAINDISGCALLGDGSISLILDPSGLVNYKYKNYKEGR